MIKSIAYFLKIGKFNLFSMLGFLTWFYYQVPSVIFIKILVQLNYEILGGCS